MESVSSLIPLSKSRGLRYGWIECRERRNLEIPILLEKKHAKKHVNELLGR
jgi:hypothetical protein